MAYWQKTIGHWVGYVWPYFFIALIINGILIYAVSGAEHGVLTVAVNALSESSNSKGSTYVVAFVLLGPLFNLYAAVVAVKSAIEADDDYHHYLGEFEHLPVPNVAARKRLIAVLSLGTGLALLPFTFWLYTAQFGALWGLDLPFIAQPGVWLSLGLVVASYALIPRFFPDIAKALYDLETSISDKMSQQ